MRLVRLRFWSCHRRSRVADWNTCIREASQVGEAEICMIIPEDLSKCGGDDSGRFLEHIQWFGNSDSKGLAVGDVDGDGDPDVFAANGQESPTVCGRTSPSPVRRESLIHPVTYLPS